MRFEIFGWVSAAHWSGDTFRIGEPGDGVDDALTEEEEKLRIASAAHEVDVLHKEYFDFATYVKKVCMPRMKACEEENVKEKLKSCAKISSFRMNDKDLLLLILLLYSSWQGQVWHSSEHGDE